MKRAQSLKPRAPAPPPRPDLALLSSEQINTLTRACLKAKDGYVLAVVDYSQVEARANAWMAGDLPAVERFKRNIDPYSALASRLYGIPAERITKDQNSDKRQVGKAAELACGYGQGPGGAKNPRKGKGYGKPYGFYGYGLKNGVDWIKAAEDDPPMTPKIVVDGWRELHAPIVQLWKALERGMLMAFTGEANTVGVGCKVRWDRWNDALVCELPSGRALVYHGVQVGKGEYGPTLTYMGGKGREHTYGGKLCENVIQAICRDFLAVSLVRAEADGLCPVLDVHDEIACEVPKTYGAEALEHLEWIMKDLPSWGKGMPIGAEGFLCERYRK